MSIPKILVVDDDMMSRQMAEFILKKGEYDIQSVQSGNEAIAALNESDYSLVLLDVDMPEKDGIETLRDIRKMDGAMKDVPVMFLTAEDSIATIVSDATLKAAGYIKKPFLPADLLSNVSKMLTQA